MVASCSDDRSVHGWLNFRQAQGQAITHGAPYANRIEITSIQAGAADQDATDLRQGQYRAHRILWQTRHTSGCAVLTIRTQTIDQALKWVPALR
jgi:hypothetical protein